jgi:hypothetical protein
MGPRLLEVLLTMLFVTTVASAAIAVAWRMVYRYPSA